jgi:phospholipid/cholesterol/gamma-HCH transport system substrate-binding protein
MKPLRASVGFTLASVVSIILLIVVVNAVTQPVAATTRTYHADFTDVSGMHEGADVRVRGVRVGKVETIRLQRLNGRSLADVGFTLDKRFGIADNTRLAIKFQALTGLRYVDVANPAESDAAKGRITNVPTKMTQPSFDITVLFNGLQPVLATLSPEEINQFAANTSLFLAGDGGGLRPMLDSARKLAALTEQREEVITGLVRNLSGFAEGVRGRSGNLIEFAEQGRRVVDDLLTVLDEFRKSDMYGPTFLGKAVELLDHAGLKRGIDPSRALDTAFTNVYDVLEAYKRTPVFWENIEPPPPANGAAPCHRGRAELPLPMDVLLNGRKVMLCNP